jgi:adenylate cyclase
MKVEDIARELDARYIVEGSIRRGGDKVRVTAQLIDAELGEHIWAERYDRQIDDLFAIQDEVTESLVSCATERLKTSRAEITRNRPEQSVSAYDLVLQSRPLRTDYSSASNRKARELLERAIELDSNSAQAYASLSFVLTGECEEGWAKDPQDTLKRATEMARKAVAIDGADGYAHASLAYAMQTAGDFDQAMHEARTALKLNPNHANIIMTCGWITLVYGNPESAIDLIRHARDLNPYMPGFDLITLGAAYFAARRYREAIEVISQAPNQATWSYIELAASYAYLGEPERAREALGTFLEKAEQYYAHFPGDDPAAWRALFEMTIVRRRKEDFDHYMEGMRLAGLPVA